LSSPTAAQPTASPSVTTTYTLTVTDSASQTATDTVTVTVSQPGALKITLDPAASVTTGAQWNVDGGVWQNSGATVSGLAAGTHTVNYKAVTGWTAPVSEQVTITSGATLQITRYYVPVLDDPGTPSSGTAPIAIQFSAMEGGSVTTHLPTGSTLNWDFGDGSAVAHGTQVSHTYNSAGTFTVALTLTLASSLGTVSCCLLPVPISGSGVSADDHGQPYERRGAAGGVLRRG
jgi:PKD repeat protein